MRLLPTIKDSRGKESHTLMFVSVAFAAILVKFVLSGLTFPFGTVPITTIGEFSMAFVAIMTPWLGREWTSKTLDSKDA